jgi:hypothetical protein
VRASRASCRQADRQARCGRQLVVLCRGMSLLQVRSPR